jgi:hypothetical protein
MNEHIIKQIKFAQNPALVPGQVCHLAELRLTSSIFVSNQITIPISEIRRTLTNNLLVEIYGTLDIERRKALTELLFCVSSHNENEIKKAVDNFLRLYQTI